MTSPLYPSATPLEDRAIRQIAGLAMDAPAKAKSGHSGTAMALAPLGVALFSRVLRHDPSHPDWPDRDRFILSNGHASILQYALAYSFGYDLSVADLEQFRQLDSRTPGHPESGVTPTVEVTTGPLGQGFANAVGMALAERVLRAQYGQDLVDHRTWVIAGDGCFEEGVSHEAASFAGFQRLDRLTAFYDDNHITIDGPTELAYTDNVTERFAAYGWHVINVGESANDLSVLTAACEAACEQTERPTLIVVRSHIGFPSPTMMDRKEAHGEPFSAAAITEAKAILGIPDTPFAVDPTIREGLIAARRDPGAFDDWLGRVRAAGERGDALLTQLRTGGVDPKAPPPAPFSGEGPVAIRKAMAAAITAVAPTSPGLFTGSADLTGNTNVALPSGEVQTRTDPAGRQVHYGIREFAMGATMVGVAKHGGLRPVGSTFFVFSDYQRPAVRLAALSHAPVLFLYTHDSVGVGEDGPTHQPIEHLMALRAMPNLHVVRPSDANEGARLLHGLLTDPAMGPTAVCLSRQEVPLLAGEAAAASMAGAARGGYVARERGDAAVTLVATGSEVPLTLLAADELAQGGLTARVVALPCWRCFDAQDAGYRGAVIPRTQPTIAVESGATLGWERYADEAIGIDEFGRSAPAAAVFAHFGFTPAALAATVRGRLAARG